MAGGDLGRGKVDDAGDEDVLWESGGVFVFYPDAVLD